MRLVEFDTIRSNGMKVYVNPEHVCSVSTSVHHISKATEVCIMMVNDDSDSSGYYVEGTITDVLKKLAAPVPTLGHVAGQPLSLGGIPLGGAK